MEPEDVSDETLMSAYCAGDASAFDRLFARMGPRVHGFFMRSFGSPQVAEDLVQTTFMKVHRARDAYRRDLPLAPWLFSIAARVRLDEYRRRRRLPEDLDEEALARADEQGGIGPEAAPVSSEQAVDDADRAARVRAAIAALPETQRVIIHLHRFEGLTFTEIARTLGTTEGAVKLRAFRAYERLRKELTPLLDEDRTLGPSPADGVPPSRVRS
jgi:RNA polymerase sigma-70 factor (ECF subfamily)